MQREIKVRVWDKGNSEWRYYLVSRLVDGLDLGSIYHIDHSKTGLFTGLKDKNGNEIYEGYIVRCEWTRVDAEYEDDIMQRIGVLEYDTPNAEWHVVFVSGSISIAGMHDLNAELEVIGNIYENPELLTV